MRTSAIKLRIKNAQETLARAEKDLRDVRARRTILCSCGKHHAIGKLALIVTHWYTPPHGCSGGAYWNEGEWQFTCPISGRRNRFLFSDFGVEYDKRDVVGVAAEPTFKSIYRGLFAAKADDYDNTPAPAYNNYYVDEHRKKFELPEKPVKK